MAVLTITEDNYEELVVGAEGKVLLDLYADWCGPCKMLAPIIKDIAAEHPEYTVGKINVDKEPGLARRFRVMSIPMIAVLEGGDVIDVAVGYRTKEDILDMLAE